MKLRCSAPLLALTSLLVASQAAAIPVAPFPIDFRNADGTTVRGRLFGDEHLSWAHDMEGFPLVYDKLDGAWHYATLGPDGRFLALPQRAGSVDPQRLGIARGLVPTRTAMERASAFKRSATPPQAIPPRGNVRNLVLLVKFNCASGCASVNEDTTYTPAQFEPVFNGATGSAKAYYSEVSYGALQLESTVANNQWIQLPYNDAYYAYNGETYNHPEEMIIDAVDVLNAQHFDFRQFDADSDGVLDAVDIIHVGPGYETTGNTSCIHSHYASLRDYNKQFRTWDGILVNAYHTEPELRGGGGQITGIGAIVHETTHFFGMPDLYDYGLSRYGDDDQSAGLGFWSLMSGGAWGGPGMNGNQPVHPDAWTKYRIGFSTPRTIGASTQGVRLRPSWANNDAVIVSAGMPTNQFFIIENRAESNYDTYIPGSGLAIYHVDESRWDARGCLDFVNCNNNEADRYLVDLEQADGRRELNLSANEMGDLGDVYPYGTRTSLTPTTSPNSLGYNQTSSGKITISAISRQSNGDITFDVQIEGGGTLSPNGTACTNAGECASGFCVDGVCCNAACNAGQCDACSRSAGAPANGTCAMLTVVCDDHNPCTAGDRCDNGACAGAEISCEAETACFFASICDRSLGGCTPPVQKPNGFTCDDGNPCSMVDSCQEGVCTGSNPMRCVSTDPCQVAAGCNPDSGGCVFQAGPDGVGCDDQDPCTENDQCQSGACVGSAKTCGGECRVGGVCDAITGQCSDAAAPDGTKCSKGSCEAGVCKEDGCGCSSSSAGPASAFFGLLLGLGLVRRRARV